MRRRILAVTALLALASYLPGCSSEPQQTADNPGGGPERVVVLGPAAAEMLESLGQLDRVVGIGDFGPWPEPLAELATVGGFASPNLEQLVSLECDMVVTTAADSANEALQQIRDLGIQTLALDTGSHDGVFDSLARMGVAFGLEDEASEIAQRMHAELEAIRVSAESLPKRDVLFVVGRDPYFAAGPDSHIDEMIRMAGGRNVMHDALSTYPQVGLETLLERAPQVIIDTSDNRPGALRGRESGAWGQWDFLPAVRDDRVYWIHPGRLVIPGVRLPEMTRLMAQLIHPETFGEAQLDEPVKTEAP